MKKNMGLAIRRTFFAIALVLLSAPIAVANPSHGDTLSVPRASFRADFLGRFQVVSSPTASSNRGSYAELFTRAQRAEGRRSLPLAFGLSAVVPGAGQALNGQWLKAAVAVAVEIVLVKTYYSKRDDGNDTEALFQAFAHADWDAGRYGDWLNDYTDYLNQEFSAGINVSEINTNIGVDFSHPEDWTKASRDAVRTMIAQINATERSVFHPETGASFSHQLPGFAEQQYYELIGKYFQFAPGWSDYPVWLDGEGNFTLAIDPERTGEGGSKPNVSGNFVQYAEDHARSQDLLRSASNVGLLIALNHVVAAIDAVVSAKLHNDRLTTRLSVSTSRSGIVEPQAGIGIRF